MTWAPCPHGVRTRGKKGAAPRIPHKGHDDSSHKGEGISIFFLCCLRFPLPLLVLFLCPSVCVDHHKEQYLAMKARRPYC